MIVLTSVQATAPAPKAAPFGTGYLFATAGTSEVRLVPLLHYLEEPDR